MNRLKNIFIIFLISLPFLTSCNRTNPAYYRNNMIGTWIVDIQDDEKLKERDYTVMSFNDLFELQCMGKKTDEDGNNVWGKNKLTYNIYCCDFSIYGKYDGLFGFSEVSTTQEYDFVSVEDSLLTLKVRSYIIDENEYDPGYKTLTMRKIPNNYAKADSLFGIWQFKTKNGQDFSDYRIQFSKNGSFVFYIREENNEWTSPSDVDKYSKYDDFLALTLFNNPVLAKEGMSDVVGFLIDAASPKTGVMKISSGDNKFELSYISAE